MLAMLQRIASPLQGLPSQPQPSPSLSLSPGTVPSSAAVALQQRQLQQLLYQHQQQQQPHSACQVPFSQQKHAASAQAAAFGSWPWQPPPLTVASLSATAIPTVTESLIAPPDFAQPPESLSALTSDQQACPRLDGSFLAECIKPALLVPCVSTCNQPSQMPLQLPLPTRQVLPASHIPAAAAAVPVPMQAERQPSASILSPTLSFSSVPSTKSSISAVPSVGPSPEAQLPVDLSSADTSFHSFGMYPITAHRCEAAALCAACIQLLAVLPVMHKQEPAHECAPGQDASCLCCCKVAQDAHLANVLCTQTKCVSLPSM